MECLDKSRTAGGERTLAAETQATREPSPCGKKLPESVPWVLWGAASTEVRHLRGTELLSVAGGGDGTGSDGDLRESSSAVCVLDDGIPCPAQSSCNGLGLPCPGSELATSSCICELFGKHGPWPALG